MYNKEKGSSLKYVGESRWDYTSVPLRLCDWVRA